ncbi:MAG: S8 family serine peptidase [Kyrpidia tusciae]|nr:S8 family serine peptidase [Kyrpidia tusciae]MBE3552553.1 S8 family serine peptidase [Kyrpidia tusciae]
MDFLKNAKAGICCFAPTPTYGDAQSSWVIQAIVQAVKDGADVINLSLGTYKSLKNPADRADLLAYQKAVAYALVHGVTVVASSGTDGVDIGNPAQLANQLGHPGDLEVHAPGGLPGVLTTAATNRQQARAYYSNYGRNVDLAAPGGDFGPLWDSEHIADVRDMCLVTYPTNLPQTPLSRMAGLPKGYEWMIGTSLAAPKVAAAAALVIAQERDKRGVRGVLGPWTNPANPVTVRNILERTAVDVGTPGRDPETGAGVVDAAKALQAVR